MADMGAVDDTTIELGKLAQRLSVGKNRDKFLELVAEEDPTIPIPEMAAKRYVADATKPILEENAKLRTELDGLKAINDVQARRIEFKKKHNVSDELFDKVEKVMVEKGIAKHESALEFIKLNQQVATPTPDTPRSPVRMPEMSKEFIADPINGARSMAHTVLDEIRKGKVA